ncbi:MAG: PAS domain S-box protein [Actinomycetota bacterium]
MQSAAENRIPPPQALPADVGSIAPAVLDLAQRLFQADAYAIWRRDPDTLEWASAGDVGLPENYPRHIGRSSHELSPHVLQFEDVAQAPMLEERRAGYLRAGIQSILAVPLCVSGEYSATLTFYYHQLHRFSADEIQAASALANLAACAFSAAELSTEQKRLREAAELAEKRSTFLARASKVLASSLDYETTLKHIAGLVVPELADWCTIHLAQPGEDPLQVAVAHADPAKLSWARAAQEKLSYDPDAPTGLANVLRTGAPELYPHISDEMLCAAIQDPEKLEIMRQVGFTSLVIVPLIARETVLGAVTLISAESGVHFDQHTMELAQDLARRAAIAIDNARLLRTSQATLAALARSEARFRRLMDANIIGIQFANERGQVTDANDAFLSMTGYDRDDLTAGRVTWCALTGGELQREPLGAVEEGSATSVERELVRKDGARFPALVGAARFAESPDEALAFILDLTDLKRAEEAVRYVTEHAHCLLWHAFVEAPEPPRAAYKWDVRLFDEQAADRFLSLERNPGESYIAAFYRHKPPEDQKRSDAAARHAFETGAPGYQLDYRCLGKDGRHHWLHEETRLDRVGPGRWRAVGVCTEITERKRLEDAALRLAAIVQSSQDAIVGVSLDGIITSWNRGAERIHGYTADEAVGRPISMLTPPEEADDLPEIMERLKRGEAIEYYETVRLRKDGSAFDASFSISPIKDPSGNVIGASKIARDITERKALEAELRRRVDELAAADQRKDEFLAMLAHELRNPLGAISNAVHVLKKPAADAATRERAVQVLQRQVLHQSRMVGDLLDVSRLTRGLVAIRRERVDLNLLLRETGEDYRATLEARGLELKLSLSDQPLWVNGDAIRLTQVVGNLISNAAKFTDAGGRVTLATELTSAGFGRVTVSDTGEGIPTPLLPVIFGSFVQGDRTLARSRGGLGLGLAIVKGLVELHGGTVRADSRGRGQGAQFSFSLPLTTAPVAAAASAIAPPVSCEALRVLVVEDNRDAAETLRDVLEMQGYEVALALTGAAALDKARDWKPDVVLCDIGLPAMDGYEVARALRGDPALNPRRLIAVTGYGEDEHRRRAQEAGFDQHLLKPVDPDALHRLLQSI